MFHFDTSHCGPAARAWSGVAQVLTVSHTNALMELELCNSTFKPNIIVKEIQVCPFSSSISTLLIMPKFCFKVTHLPGRPSLTPAPCLGYACLPKLPSAVCIMNCPAPLVLGRDAAADSDLRKHATFWSYAIHQGNSCFRTASLASLLFYPQILHKDDVQLKSCFCGRSGTIIAACQMAQR